MSNYLREKYSELYQSLKSAYNQPFQGWDFSLLEDQIVDHPLSWDYRDFVELKIRSSHSMLDMGTGGGEFLSSLDPFPPYTCATEAYPPNVPIAKARLEPLGIEVFQIGEDNFLPIQDNTFDLVINRHEEYLVSEVKRVLKPGGYFLTQQVGGLNDKDINQKLGENLNSKSLKWDLKYAVNDLETHGFSILEQKEEFPLEQFKSVEVLVYFLKAVPWQVPGFSIEKHFDRLLEIHHGIQLKGSFDVKMHRFLIFAQKI